MAALPSWSVNRLSSDAPLDTFSNLLNAHPQHCDCPLICARFSTSNVFLPRLPTHRNPLSFSTNLTPYFCLLLLLPSNSCSLENLMSIIIYTPSDALPYCFLNLCRRRTLSNIVYIHNHTTSTTTPLTFSPHPLHPS